MVIDRYRRRPLSGRDGRSQVEFQSNGASFQHEPSLPSSPGQQIVRDWAEGLGGLTGRAPCSARGQEEHYLYDRTDGEEQP